MSGMLFREELERMLMHKHRDSICMTPTLSRGSSASSASSIEAIKPVVSPNLVSSAIAAGATIMNVELNDDGSLVAYATENGRVKVVSRYPGGSKGITYLAEDENGKRFVVKALTIHKDAGRIVHRAWTNKSLKMAVFETSNHRTYGHESELLLDPENTHLFVSMPEVSGVNLREKLAALTEQMMQQREANHTGEALSTLCKMLEMLAQAMRILDGMHAKGLVHGDAWLENFMVREIGGKIEVELIDFGGCCPIGITTDEYFARGYLLDTGAYHTAPELPCISNNVKYDSYAYVISDRARMLQKELKQTKDPNKKQEIIVALRYLIEEAARIVDKDVDQKIKYRFFMSHREYDSLISGKTDLHALVASFIFETLIPAKDDGSVLPTGAAIKAADDYDKVILSFMHWAMSRACNSDWMLDGAGIKNNCNRAFIAEAQAARDTIMHANGYTASEQARATVPEAIQKVDEFIKHLKDAEQRTPRVSVRERIRAIESRHVGM